MALRDTWHKALVYFGLAEEHDYGPEYEEEFIPEDEDLWKTESFREFLDARRKMLAQAMTQLLKRL